jgi:hypothetical protein
MKWLTDRAVDRLRIAIQLPDLTNTRYRAPHFIGSGGMGTVWLAKDTTLHRKVALKVLHFGDGSTDSGSRLMREAQILAALEHPNIVPIHDAGSLADGSLYYAMKYVEGERLDQWLSTVVSQMERLHLWLRIADAIAFAHSKGIIHRDLKPENIMIGHFNGELLTDETFTYRICAILKESPATGNRTGERLVIGDVRRMNKILVGLILGTLLGIFDGLTAWFTPAVRSGLVGIVFGSTLKGLIAGAIIGAFAPRVGSLTLGLIFGLAVGLLLAVAVAYMQHGYYFQIMLPGGIVGLIVGYATQRYGRGAYDARTSPAH